MKHIIVGLYILCCPSLLWADNASILFDQKDYFLVSVSESHEKAVNQYVPKDQSLEHWQSMLSLHIDKKLSGVSPIEFARQLGASLKKNNPAANFQVYGNNEDNEAMIDFLTWKNEIVDNAEFNALKIKKDRKTGYLIILQFVQAIKPSSELKNIDEFKHKRSHWLKELATQTFPVFISQQSLNMNQM
jgi:hypothetical protein